MFSSIQRRASVRVACPLEFNFNMTADNVNEEISIHTYCSKIIVLH